VVFGLAQRSPEAPSTLLAVHDRPDDTTDGDGSTGRPGERIGVLGGTFDPLHIGHVMIALEVRHALALDRMLLVVANDPWQKSAAVVASAEARLELTRAGVDSVNARLGSAVLEVSDVEILRGGESYTADTLEELHRRHLGAEFFLLVGSDTAAGLSSWKHPDRVQAQATTVVVDRGGHRGDRPPHGWPHLVVEVPLMEVSSSDLRERFTDGRPVEALVPSSVIDCIRRRGLYGTRS
jgi:nicotinate-nucleotide adenylyltransferase